MTTQHYAFHSAKQSAVVGPATWITFDGKEVFATEISTKPEPIGLWDDYVSLGLVDRCIRFSSPKEDFSFAQQIQKLNFIDYLSKPHDLIIKLTLLMGDRPKAKIAALQGFVFSSVFHNAIPYENLYEVLELIGFSRNEIAREIVVQKRNRSSHFSVN